ncbi:tRNA pseudouridine(13) synthase TruD [Halorientalis marina]|jgi:tRNA pseudouridine13 synthase|uniref:tRNA pseudouridine(13) synthase TruD n=1 Tax=Halorientalis marina TaxID=2931976 RepID=UPI001FF5B1D0|nr:tRNA pseudouridine(13) synthase TruD [Halorientalis marina]
MTDADADRDCRAAHPVERAVGMAYYVSDVDGIGGRLRADPEDFRVTEIEAFESEPVDADPGAYNHVLLRATLRDWDTNDFAAALSDALGASRERVSWAGTKDKRAVTTQLFTVRDADPEAVAAVDLGGADIEVLGRTGRDIFFGDLAGNAFEIVVRDPDAPEHVDAVTADLRAFAGVAGEGERGADGADDPADAATVGVPNYFGQQRFGSRRPVTHEIGLAVLRDDWEGAVLAYVGNPSDREPAETREAREYVEETRDWQGGLDRMPEWLGYERAMLHELAERGSSDADDFRAALETAPTNLQRLFVNAAQSALFNRMLSARLERGLPFDRPVAGDAVCFADRDAPDDLPLPDTDRTQRVDEDRVDTVTRHCERGRAFVTAPLVGTETTLAPADTEPGEIERTVLNEAGIEPADFDLPGEFHSTGTRRAVLVRTDLAVTRDPLTFEFRLPKGSYATVLLREYLKGDPDGLD